MPAMASFTSISIIYNPNSTGSGKQMAEELREELKKLMPKASVEMVKTKRPRHGQELAYKLAKASKRALVISASGDGGYHDVINGLLKAQAEGATPVASLIPAGNANDHFHNVHEGDLAKAIKRDEVRKLDVLKLKSTVDGKPFERYAHSYIGLGLTPAVGEELNKVDLNWFNQAWIVLKTLFFLQPVTLSLDGRRRRFDSVIFSNVTRMSKVLQISKTAEQTDGKFEVTLFKRSSKWRLIVTLLRASTTGLAGAQKTDKYEFETIKEVLVQLDGEIFTLDPKSPVTVTLESELLRCII